MAESRLVPCNLLAWPAIRDLLPDQKLLVYHMWVTCPSAAGCCLLDYAGFQGALSITANAVEDAVMEFERRGLVEYDRATGEVFILAWFRWHKFDTATRRRLLEDALKKVESPRLKTMILEKSMAYALRKGKEREDKSSLSREAGGAGCSLGEGDEDEGEEVGVPPPVPPKTGPAGAQESQGARKGMSPSNPTREETGRVQRPQGVRKGMSPPQPPKRESKAASGGRSLGEGVEVTVEGICYQHGNVRDMEALTQIRAYAPELVQQAVVRAAGADDRGRAWPAKTLRILKGGTGAEAPVDVMARVLAAMEGDAPGGSPARVVDLDEGDWRTECA